MYLSFFVKNLKIDWRKPPNCCWNKIWIYQITCDFLYFLQDKDYAIRSRNIYIFVPYGIFNFVWNVFNSNIKISYIVTIHIQSYLMNFKWFASIKIYYVCTIIYHREVISGVKTVKSRFLLIFLYFKIS